MRASLLKLLLFCAASAGLFYFYTSVRDFNDGRAKMTRIFKDLSAQASQIVYKQESDQKNYDNSDESIVSEKEDTKLRYILQWTSPRNVPFVYMGKGQQGFIDRKCKYTNCFVTADKNYLGDVTKFDAIAFAGPEVIHYQSYQLPQERSPHQKYAFASIESADNYPVCSNVLDGFFNWTWTYRLASESKWGYIVIRDSEGKIIGPKTEMNWLKLEEMKPVTEDLKNLLRKKTKAAAWFVSNCGTRSNRERFVKQLTQELDKYDMTIDIYGSCGNMKCSRDNERECDLIIEKDYFFYLSFENSFSEDYVTEKLLHALKFNAIPIVYGGANYTRFMPDGIYLNARELGVEKLAAKMNELKNDIDKYSEYFRWKSHYSYYRRQESVETDDYCGFCKILNDKEKVKETTIYKNFKEWWNPPGKC